MDIVETTHYEKQKNIVNGKCNFLRTNINRETGEEKPL